MNDQHIARSKTMIADAARLAGSGTAAILGCGRCGEIPLEELGQTFDAIDLIDLDRSALESVATHCHMTNSTTWRLHEADLTGLIAHLEPRAREIAAASNDPRTCLDRFREMLDATPPDLWRPPHDQRYRLVVCSSILTQLQATTRKVLHGAFISQFPEHGSELSSYEPWRNALWTWARALEDAFLHHLDALCAGDGVIYLSDTVHVCWLTEVAPEQFATEGAWIATRTVRLRDYVDADHEVLREERWEWLRKEQEGRYCGRLYGVQAITYRPRKEAIAP